MAKSLTTRFMELEKENEEKPIDYDDQFDSSEYHPDHFGVGAVTSKVFEEMYDEQDEWETFFTTMFFLGIFLIPLQLIFADDIKPYDAYLIEKIQHYFIFTDIFNKYFFTFIRTTLSLAASIKFFISITVFFYLCFDPGVAFKTSLVAGCGSYIVFILKIISHDARPFWVNPNVKPGLCKLSFGSPSLDVFVGMLYSHYIFFCTKRALMSNDDIINLNRSPIQVSYYISIVLMFLNAFVAIFYFCFGVNFIYQILISFFYGFILIRIIIIFNKDIDHFANGSRFIKEISNVSAIIVMFLVAIFSIISCIIYEIINPDLLLPREWTENISNYCVNTNESTALSIKLTFLDSTAIFHILGATLGVNYVLKRIDNPYYWFITSWWQRLIRGTIGFLLNLFLVSILNYVQFVSVTADYMIHSFIYALAGFLLYGIMPLLYSYMGLTDQDYGRKKKEKLRSSERKKKTREKESNSSFNMDRDYNKFGSLTIEEEDDRYSK